MIMTKLMITLLKSQAYCVTKQKCSSDWEDCKWNHFILMRELSDPRIKNSRLTTGGIQKRIDPEHLLS